MLNKLDSLRLLKQMLCIRMFEEACAEQYSAGRIRGFLHLYIGEEAVAAGVIDTLSAEDSIFATYREHGHALARGVPMSSVMAEMFGKVEGSCRGRGGSMHIFDAERHFYGGNAIVGGALPLAVGLALAEKMRRTAAVVVCFFGEGAMAEGEFHESVNLACLWQLPVLFVCENNLYAMGTALERSESEVDLVKKAASYRMNAGSVDGMDVLACRQAAQKAITTIRQNSAPYFLECKTYRFRAHSMFDPELYRDKKEVEKWKQRDPIKLWSQRMIEGGLLSESERTQITAAINADILAAIAFAEQGHEEQAEDLCRFVYSEKDSEAINGKDYLPRGAASGTA